MFKFDVAILGAGAAGMMCAIEAARRGRRVVLIDHAKAIGQKIRISGGGRCNFTNMYIEPKCFLSNNPKFALSALSRFTQWDFIDRVVAHGIPYHEKTLGQLFCDNSAKDIIAMLAQDMQDAGVTVWLNSTITEARHTTGFQLSTSRGSVQCDSFVVASGGKSIPKMGATGFGLQLAQQFGLPLTQTRPALVPLTFGERDRPNMAALAGLSVDAILSHQNTAFQEGMLFTHRGLSGPSVLQISSYWREGDSLSVNLHPSGDVFDLLSAQKQVNGKQAVQTALARVLPRKLAEYVMRDCPLQGNLADQSNKGLQAVADRVHRWQVIPSGSEGYRTAEVMLGGVDTNALNAKTLEARTVPGLFFIGEVVDVTGWLGGYNFQWAWSSGWAAGQKV